MFQEISEESWHKINWNDDKMYEWSVTYELQSIISQSLNHEDLSSKHLKCESAGKFAGHGSNFHYCRAVLNVYSAQEILTHFCFYRIPDFFWLVIFYMLRARRKIEIWV